MGKTISWRKGIASLNATDVNAWVSDGSMIPASAGILDDKSITVALTGPTTMTMKLNGRNSNILHGEVIRGHILSPIDCDDHIHLNSVRFLQDTRVAHTH